MMRLEWAKQLSVGNAIIDSDHQKLITMINCAEDMIKKKDNFAMSLAFTQIEHYLHVHFVNEEMFAQALNFPFALHKLGHQNMRTAIDLTKHELKKNGIEITPKFVMEHYAQFLRNWLIKHITEEDMLMKPVLQTRPYDFKIGEAHFYC